MPQSSAALRQKAEALRLLRDPQAPVRVTGPSRPVWAKTPLACQHGTCLALDVRVDGLWVLVRTPDAQEAWAPIRRILPFDRRKDWSRRGFG